MNRQELAAALLSTADDTNLSRSERTAVRKLLADHTLSDAERRAIAADLTDGVADRVQHPKAKALVEWLGDVLPLLLVRDVDEVESRAWFGPEDPMVETLVSMLRSVRQSVDIAVFTLTDDRLTAELMALHERGKRVRILTDNDKAWDRGSDVRRLSDAGVPVAQDRSDHHFHHKFAIFDGERLVNGSYNWTRGADHKNRENFMVTDNPALVARYTQAFDSLWEQLG